MPIRRSLLSRQSLYKFHFHESTLFKQSPQTSIINKVILDNNRTNLITKGQEQMLQKSFDSILKTSEVNMNSWGSNRMMNKLYSQVYYPFLDKDNLDKYFQNTMNLQHLKKFILKHIRLSDDAVTVLKSLEQNPCFDYGILRSSYLPSLGLLNDYQQILKDANHRAFRHHFRKQYNFSDPLSSTDNGKNELILTDYLKKSSSLHKGIDIKDYFIINSPQQSEFFISLSSKIGSNTILVTGDNFNTPSSTVYELIKKYSSLKASRNLIKCQEIHNQLSNMKSISVKNMKEMIMMFDVLQDPYVRVSGNTTDVNNFNSVLNDLELSILGEYETNYPVSRL